MPFRESRRILLDGNVVDVVRHGEELIAGDGRTVGIDEAVHLPPTTPSKIICVHLNYSSRVEEMMQSLPPAPTYFHKPVTALNAHESAVVRPLGCKWLNYEGEIAIVVGRTARNISPDEAADYIRGYSIANDYGLHDFRDTDSGSMLRVKGSDTLCPVGPGLVEGWDFHGKRIRTLVNGQVRQDGNTDEMKWDMHYLVARRPAALGHPSNISNGLPGRRGGGCRRRARHAPQPHRRRADGNPQRCGRSTHRI
jgi:5-oxopent-3-ene-1,2,5-tricarboxylate decarboxylase / 2-hydroxyhepta-2,4-diene-1,7-dioate isomerase